MVIIIVTHRAQVIIAIQCSSGRTLVKAKPMLVCAKRFNIIIFPNRLNCTTYFCIARLPCSVRLSRFEKTNEMLVNCNALAAIRLDHSSKDLKRHIGKLQELQKDIEGVFKRIRTIRSKLSQQYPDAFTCKLISRSKRNATCELSLMYNIRLFVCAG